MVDGEIGRFQFFTHSIIDGDQILFNTARDFFCELNSREFYKTTGFKEIAYIYGDTDLSFRKTAALINRWRWQLQGGTPYRTLQDCTEKEGMALLDFMGEKTKSILAKNEFTDEGIYNGSNPQYLEAIPETIPVDMVKEAGKKLKFDPAEMLNNPVPYECPTETVNVSIDDVNAIKQKETREKGNHNKERQRQYVHNTVVHIEKGGLSYTLNGHGIKNVLCYLIAFIFHNDLTGNRYQFFTDGHRFLNDKILKLFTWYKNLGIILDWFHLVKKCKEQLSMAMKGRNVRNQVLRDLMPLLWHGLTNKAISYLEEIDDKNVRNTEILYKLIEYLQRNTPYIPCYAIRKKLGLRNSSCIGEKMNDLLVSSRQKRNGMSWSKNGSVALATITSLKRNREDKKWFEEKKLNYKLAA